MSAANDYVELVVRVFLTDARRQFDELRREYGSAAESTDDCLDEAVRLDHATTELLRLERLADRARRAPCSDAAVIAAVRLKDAYNADAPVESLIERLEAELTVTATSEGK